MCRFVNAAEQPGLDSFSLFISYSLHFLRIKATDMRVFFLSRLSFIPFLSFSSSPPIYLSPVPPLHSCCCFTDSLPHRSIPISPGGTVAAPSTGRLGALWAGSAVVRGDCILEVFGCLAEADGRRLARMNVEALHLSPRMRCTGRKSSETGQK